MGRKKSTTPKLRSLSLSANALRNLDEITGYIAFIQLQPNQAITIGDTFFRLFERIAVSPQAFNECPQLPTKGKLYRQAKCLSWYIVYKITDTEIIVLGIIHRSRKPTTMKRLRRTKE